MIVNLKNDLGMVKQVKVGFSWTSFFFGFWPFLFRGMVGKFFLWWLLCIVTAGLGSIYLWFSINKITATYWLEQGYKPVGPGWDIAAAKWGLVLPAVAAGSASQQQLQQQPQQAQQQLSQ